MVKPLRSICSTALFVAFACIVGQAREASWPKTGWSAPAEKQLLETLHSGAPAEKALACKQLAIHGSKAAVPELAKLLSDEQLASSSRIALEAIPDPSADAALLEAAKSLKGRLLVGTINSIGVRKSADAIDALAGHLKDADTEVASASAVALGRIGNGNATETLRQALAGAAPGVRSAVAEGCVLCAERLLADGKGDQATKLYDQIRQADVPKQRALEATRGAILARGAQGIPLLIEQLKSSDIKRFALGLTVARELPGQEIAEAISSQLASVAPERASLMVIALGDREGELPPAVVRAASAGEKQVRLAAIEVVGQKGNASTVPALLEIATDNDAELSQAAKAALANLPSEKVNAELAHRLAEAKGKSLAVLIELVGQRRIDAVPELVKALKQGDETTRNAALAALGATVGPKDLAVLISQVTSAKSVPDAKAAEQALQTACIRMPDRESTAAQLAAVVPQASTGTRASLLRVLGAMGGSKALETIAATVKGGNEEIQDVGTRVLGEWMTVEAAPVLLEISKGDAPDKYRVRALRGYLRLARQQKMPDAARLEMCREALAVAQRNEERELVLDALKRCPSAESVQLASSLMDDAQARDRAVEVAIFIGEKIKDKDPAAAKSAGEKALKAAPQGKMADRARALSNSK